MSRKRQILSLSNVNEENNYGDEDDDIEMRGRVYPSPKIHSAPGAPIVSTSFSLKLAFLFLGSLLVFVSLLFIRERSIRSSFILQKEVAMADLFNCNQKKMAGEYDDPNFDVNLCPGCKACNFNINNLPRLRESEIISIQDVLSQERVILDTMGIRNFVLEDTLQRLSLEMLRDLYGDKSTFVGELRIKVWGETSPALLTFEFYQAFDMPYSLYNFFQLLSAQVWNGCPLSYSKKIISVGLSGDGCVSRSMEATPFLFSEYDMPVTGRDQPFGKVVRVKDRYPNYVENSLCISFRYEVYHNRL